MARKDYSDVDTNTLHKMYLAAEGKEREDTAEELYRRGKLLCMRVYWDRFRDVPFEVAEDVFHDAWMYVLEKRDREFKGFLPFVFRWRIIGWIRRIRKREILVPFGQTDPEEEGLWSELQEAVCEPVDLDSVEREERIWDCIQSLHESQRVTIELHLEGIHRGEMEERLAGSAIDRLYHAKENIKKCLRERYGWEIQNNSCEF